MNSQISMATVSHFRGQELLHLTFTTTMPALRRMLKAPTEDVFRTALRVMAHYIRYLAPHCEVWTLGSWRGSRFFWGSSFGGSPSVQNDVL